MDNNHGFAKLEIPLVAKLFVIYESAHKMIFSLPKFERYTLGEKIENTILGAIELTIIANTVSRLEREKILSQTNAKIELLKILYRLALNCQMIEGPKYLAMERHIQDAGRQAMGWLKYERSTK
jgi:hypothetical protein